MDKAQKRKQVLDRVAGYICRDRNSTHGEPEDSFAQVAFLWTWWLEKRGLLHTGATLDPKDVCQMMTFLKDVRKLANMENQDHWDDSVGYQAIAASFVHDRPMGNAELSIQP